MKIFEQPSSRDAWKIVVVIAAPFYFASLLKRLQVDAEIGAEPERAFEMIALAVAGLGMHQDGEPLAVEHQPRHHPGELLGREERLVHRLQMRPDELVVPAAEPDAELA